MVKMTRNIEQTRRGKTHPKYCCLGLKIRARLGEVQLDRRTIL